MDDERKRKKYTLYLHPEKAADFQTLEAIESVPRSERGELFRNAFISGMALHQLDPRLPVLLTAILSEEFSADQVVPYSVRRLDGSLLRPISELC